MQLPTTYLQYVGQEHRKQYAQYFTPRPIASFMSGWVLGGQKQNKLFDPAFGLGAFFSACSPDIEFTGMEIDEKILDFYSSHNKNKTARIEHCDYLLTYGRKFANIVCNPPYLKFQHFEQKEAVLKLLEQYYGIKLSGYTNIASAFLAKSICELEEKGRLAYIMPSEFFNAGYGRQIKELLIQKRHLAYVIRIDCEQEAFPDATTSLCILLYDTSKEYRHITFSAISQLSELESVLTKQPLCSIAYSDIKSKEKWAQYLTPEISMRTVNTKQLVSLATYGHFSRGIATGANEFFVLRKSSIDKIGLQETEFSPCITKSSQVTKPVFTENDFNSLASTDAPVYLLNVRDNMSEAANSYIKFGEKQGYNQGYITRNRLPWYKMESRQVAPIILNVFSRQGYKVVRNLSNVFSLTNFHCFYPNLLGHSRVNALFLYLLSDAGHFILSSAMRKYGNGLDKFEPNDLNQALVPSEEYLDGIAKEQIQYLLLALLNGKNIDKELDELFSPLIKEI